MGIHTRPRRSLLLVDDAGDVRQALMRYLAERHLDVTAVDTVDAARELLQRHRFDAVLLDVDVEDGTGMPLAQDICARGGPPLVIVSNRAGETDRILGLEMGADDYLAKPVAHGELHARLRALWRRVERTLAPARRLARVTRWLVDLSDHTVRDTTGAVSTLTSGEASLLSAFLHHPMRVLSRAELLQLTHHDEADVFDRTIDVLVARLRRKLDDSRDSGALIETVRGRGYRLVAPVEWEPQRA